MPVETELKLVSIGGGTGQFSFLNGIKRHINPEKITAIVTPTDNGGSSGKLSEDYGVLPPGDGRQCLLALAPDDIQKLLYNDHTYRFTEGPFEGHNLANIELAAYELMYGSPEAAFKFYQRKHHIPGNIFPITSKKNTLIAQLEDGNSIVGETNIDLRFKNSLKNGDQKWKVKIDHIALAKPSYLHQDALDAIMDADVVTFPPGDLYTSILPSLLVNGASEAIVESKAIKVYCGNIMTKPGETDYGIKPDGAYDCFKASDFIKEMVEYLNSPCLDLVILNKNNLPEKALFDYAKDYQHPVEPDIENCQALIPKAVIKVTPLAAYKRGVVRHNSSALARTLLESLYEIRSKRAA